METNKLVFSGVVGFISERESGQSKKGNDYQKGFFIVGEPDVKYPNEMKFEWYREGESKTLDNLHLGHEVEVVYSSSVKEYQGKYYGSLQMRSLKNFTCPIDEPQQAAASGENKYSALKQPAQSEVATPPTDGNGLPF